VYIVVKGLAIEAASIPTLKTLALSAIYTTDTTVFAAPVIASLGGLTAGRVPYANSATTLIDSANLTFDGTTLSVGGRALLGRIHSNLGIYVSTTGSDTTGDGSIGNPYATLAKALDYLSNYWIDAGYNVIIDLAAGTYSAAVVVPPHPCGVRIQIYGQGALSSLTVNSVVSSSGGTGAWSYVLQMNSVTGLAVGDYIAIVAATAGTKPGYLNGYHEITNVDVPNTQITITCTHQSATPASGAVTSTTLIYKTYLTGAISFAKQQFGMLASLGLIGPGSGTGLTVESSYVGIRYLGIAHWYSGIYVTQGGALGANDHITLSSCGLGVNASYYGSTNIIVILSGCSYGVYTAFGGNVTVGGTSWITGCYYGAMATCQGRVGNGTYTVEACVVGQKATESSHIFGGSYVTFLDCGTDTSPALNTQGNAYSYISTASP
jgi:hypothetical protein